MHQAKREEELKAYIHWLGELRKKPKNAKHSIGETLWHHYKATGKMPQALTPPECEWGWLFGYYEEISLHGKEYGMGGASPIKWSELEAWSRLNAGVLRDDELLVIMAIDRIMLEQEARQQNDDGRNS